MHRSLALVAAVLGLTLAAPIADAASGPPFQVVGVMNVQSLGTFISCTNIGTVVTDVTIEFFDQTGGIDSSAGPLTLNPRASALFGTRAATGFLVSVDAGSGSILVGSAKISSTQKTLACTAFLADVNSGPPTSMVSLTIISRKQKGD